MRVLLAEDGMVNQKVAVLLIQQQGHQVTVANDGVEALEAAVTQVFDLILMDIQMPHLDGLAAARAIRQQGLNQRTSIFAMTASREDDPQACLRAGMDGFLPKPLCPNELSALLQRHQAEPEESLGDDDFISDDFISDDFRSGRSCGGVDQARKLADSMLKEAAQLMDEIRTGIADGDHDRVTRGAHTLKSSSALFGAQVVAEAAREMEVLGHNGQLAAAEQALPRLAELVERFGAELVTLAEV